MEILLLSRHTGAVAPFLAAAVGAGHGRLRLGYVDDAQRSFAQAPFVEAERAAVDGLGHDVVRITVRDTTPAELDALLASLDVLYVASGSTFALLESLRTTGNAEVIVAHVRRGLPYIGASAGSIVAGPDATPASLLDDPADGPLLTDLGGLGLVDQTVVPHADGQLPPYPPKLIQQTLDTYGREYELVPLRDDQALRVDDSGARVIDSGS